MIPQKKLFHNHTARALCGHCQDYAISLGAGLSGECSCGSTRIYQASDDDYTVNVIGNKYSQVAQFCPPQCTLARHKKNKLLEGACRCTYDGLYKKCISEGCMKYARHTKNCNVCGTPIFGTYCTEHWPASRLGRATKALSGCSCGEHNTNHITETNNTTTHETHTNQTPEEQLRVPGGGEAAQL